MQGRPAPLTQVGKNLDSFENPSFSQNFPLRLERFQGLSILRKFGIPNFYLDGLRNIKRLGSEKIGNVEFLISVGRSSKLPILSQWEWLSAAKAIASNCAAEKLKCPENIFYKIEQDARARLVRGHARRPAPSFQNRSTQGRSSTSSDQALRGWRSTST